MKFAAHVTEAVRAPDPDHCRRRERLVRLQMIAGGKRIDAAQGADAVDRCRQKRIENCPTMPANRPARGPLVSVGGAVERENKGRIAKLIRAHAEFGIQHFGARRELLGDGTNISFAQSPKKCVR